MARLKLQQRAIAVLTGDLLFRGPVCVSTKAGEPAVTRKKGVDALAEQNGG